MPATSLANCVTESCPEVCVKISEHTTVVAFCCPARSFQDQCCMTFAISRWSGGKPLNNACVTSKSWVSAKSSNRIATSPAAFVINSDGPNADAGSTTLTKSAKAKVGSNFPSTDWALSKNDFRVASSKLLPSVENARSNFIMSPHAQGVSGRDTASTTSFVSGLSTSECFVHASASFCKSSVSKLRKGAFAARPSCRLLRTSCLKFLSYKAKKAFAMTSAEKKVALDRSKEATLSGIAPASDSSLSNPPPASASK
mmetsp:Transcript_15432/g.35233  ORF Transcript_15432/g.35233 Transcript_15432/m.35233 type:complete len:256 (-) Transcript_15432:1721-2488(-)